MPYAVILMQENYLFRSLAPNQVITQPQSQAVNVAPYRYITPFVHVLTSPDNDIPTAGMGEVQAITLIPEKKLKVVDRQGQIEVRS